jgi:hypothetical protein
MYSRALGAGRALVVLNFSPTGVVVTTAAGDLTGYSAVLGNYDALEQSSRITLRGYEGRIYFKTG